MLRSHSFTLHAAAVDRQREARSTNLARSRKAARAMPESSRAR
jgi:hypothetical protein